MKLAGNYWLFADLNRILENDCTQEKKGDIIQPSNPPICIFIERGNKLL
jgi:hypothetical protein